MRKIAVMIGSDSDLKQCVPGLEYLETKAMEGVIKNRPKVITCSIHRNTCLVLDHLRRLAKSDVDCIIIGAGMANHLSGTCDAFLRNALKNDRLIVIAVAFKHNDRINTSTAVLSITRVPGHQMVFNNYIGEEGFLAACRFAVEGKLPAIAIPPYRETIHRTLTEAINEAKRLLEKETK
jgi:phosphoribosylcarboxyaminoimidazole (NCAIR) mutase